MIDQRLIDGFNARAPFRWEEATPLVVANIGSHSHGTYVPPEDPNAIDDIDYMVVVIPPPSYVIGTKQWDGTNYWADELDVVVYSFRKFVGLLLKSNPNVLGLLWLREQDYKWKHPAFDRLCEQRDIFSSLDAYQSFIGYAYGQLKKMTAFDEATSRAFDEAVALIEAAGWTKEQIINDEHREMPTVLTGNATWDQRPMEALNAAIVTIKRIHARHFQGYMGEKRKALVRQFGYDTKNAAHLLRLLRMCVEFLTDGRLSVYRAYDGDFFRAVKQGAYSLEQVQAWAEMSFATAKFNKELSPLPEHPDYERADLLVQAIHWDVLAGAYDA